MFVLDPWVWVFCLTALAYLHSGIFQLFPIPGWVDAGIYLGYALNLPDLVERFAFDGLTYHGSRLSYVLPRFLIRQVLDPTAAQYFETDLLYLASLFSVFAIGWHAFGRSATFLAAALLAFNPIFLSSLTFGGTDGAAICYQLLSAAFLFSPDGLSGRRRALSASGFFAGLAMAAHLFSLVPLSGIALAHVVLSGFTRRQLLRYGWLAGGAVLSVTACGVVGTVFGLDFFFLGYSQRILERAIQGVGAEYRWPWSEWLFGSYRVLVPAALLVHAALLANFFKDKSRQLWMLGLAALFPLLFYVVWDAVIGGVLIQTRSYSALLLPCVLISLLAFSRLSLDHLALNGRTAALGCLVIALPSLAVSDVPGVFDAIRIPPIQPTIFGTLAVGLAVLLLAARTVVRQTRNKLRSLTWLATLVVFSTCAALDLDSMPVYRTATGLNYEQAYEGSVRLVKWLEESGIGARKPVFWFDRAELNDRLGERGTYRVKYQGQVLRLNYFDSLASLYLWNQSLLSADLPEVDASVLDRDPPPDAIVVLALDTSTLEQARNRLRTLAYVPARLGSLDYEGDDFAWHAEAFAIAEPAQDIADVSAVSVTPGSGSGSSQTFTLQFADSRGASYLKTEWVWFNAAFAKGPNSCMIYHDRAANTLHLLDDAGVTWLSGTLGRDTLQNGQCAIALENSSAALNGTTLTLTLALTFTSTFTGTKNVYMFANAAGRLSSGWHDRGDWSVPSVPATSSDDGPGSRYRSVQ